MNNTYPTPTTGFSVTGVVKGFFERQNGQYTNRFIAVVTGSYQDKYGQEADNIQDVEVSPKMADYARQTLGDTPNLQIRLWIGVDHKKGEKNGRAWSFVRYYLRENGIEILTPAKQQKSA